MRGLLMVKERTPKEPELLCFTAEEASSSVQLTQTGSPTVVSLETSTDGITRSDYTIGDTITLSNIGDKVYMRNKSETQTGFSTGTTDYYKFVMSGKIAASGDINCLICRYKTKRLSDYCYQNLFNGCTSLTTAPKLPATTLAMNCYHSMFRDCTSLTTAPELPATAIGRRSYHSMFYGCTSLITPPELPATTLTPDGYNSMFRGCTSLTTAPELPATALNGNCYTSMFRDCTSLTTLPKLPATKLAQYCYSYMFYNCKNIKISSTQTGDYQTEYRIPYTGTGTDTSGTMGNMFLMTGGTFRGTPTINTTYYTSNTLVPSS